MKVFPIAKQVFYNLSHTSRPFWFVYFGDGVLQTICSGLATNLDPPDLSLSVAKITGVSHQAKLLYRIFMWGTILSTWCPLGFSELNWVRWAFCTDGPVHFTCAPSCLRSPSLRYS
jgi:hypothetical protein